jgi:hypothetical protein
MSKSLREEVISCFDNKNIEFGSLNDREVLEDVSKSMILKKFTLVPLMIFAKQQGESSKILKEKIPLILKHSVKFKKQVKLDYLIKLKFLKRFYFKFKKK